MNPAILPPEPAILRRVLRTGLLLLLATVFHLEAATCTFPDWVEGTPYEGNAKVLFGGELYICSAPNYSLCGSIAYTPQGSSSYKAWTPLVWESLGAAEQDSICRVQPILGQWYGWSRPVAASSGAPVSSGVLGSSGGGVQSSSSGVQSSSGGVQSSSSQALSLAISSSQGVPVVGQPDPWSPELWQTTRCDLTMDMVDEGECIFPQQLQGAILRVPRNVTRFSKNAFRLCGVQATGAPTAVIYIMDHSASMSYPSNDPTGIAAGAFHAALRRQAAIDSASAAGYIPFSTGVLADTVPPAPLGSVQLGRMLTAIHSTYDGSTNYVQPITLAQQWLARPQFDGWNKLIVFLSDGAPNESWLNSAMLLAEPGAPTLHGMYMGAASDPGYKVVDFLSWLTQDPRDGSRGTFHHIAAVGDLEPVIDQLIQTYVYSVTPTSMELHHHQTQMSIAVDQSQLVDLGDTSFSVIMDNNMPLVRGLNQLSLRSTYSSGNAIEITFQVEVTDTIMNSELQLQGAPFQTTCYAYNGMTILDSRRLQVDLLDRTDDRCFVQFSTEATNNYGDSLAFRLQAGSGDREEFPAYLQTGGADPGYVLYEAEVPIAWLAAPVAGDGLLQVNRLDSLEAQWQHPDDDRDAIGALQDVLWRIPRVDSLAFFDDDHDGRLDRLRANFATPVHPTDLPLLEWSVPWTDRWGSVASLPQPHLAEAGGVTISSDSLRVEWLPVQDSLAERTGLEGVATVLQVVGVSPRPDWRPSDTVRPVALDSMAPLLRRARVLVDARKGEEPVDTLRLYFTETIDWAGSGNIPLYDFMVRQQGERRHREELAYDYTEWFQSRPSEMRILMSGHRNASFRVHPGDSVRMRTDVPALRDLAGNSPWASNPYVYIDGNLRAEIVHPDIGTPSDQVAPNDTALVVHVVPGGTNLLDWLEERGTLGIGWGPIKVFRDEQSVDRLTFPWSISIFDHLGQFVAQRSGMVDCRTPEFAEACRSEDGVSLVFEWNYRSDKGRAVGSGAYVFRARLDGDEQFLRLGVRR